MINKDELAIVNTREYIRLLKSEKKLLSITEGKDYNWLMKEYKEVEAKIKDMVVIDIGEEE